MLSWTGHGCLWNLAALCVVGAGVLPGCTARAPPTEVTSEQAPQPTPPANAVPRGPAESGSGSTDRQAPPPAPAATPISRTPVTSSALNSVGYDESQKILAIEFHGGEVYEYYDVPAQVYHDLMAAASKGRYFHQHIRNGDYKFARVEGG